MTLEEFLTILFSMQPALAQYYGGKSGCQWQEDNVRAHFESASAPEANPLQPTTTPISAENRNADPVQETAVNLSTMDGRQERCLEIGFKYWRAPDAHGVECTQEQALEFLRDCLGVEVEIKEAPAPAKHEPLPGCVCPKCGQGHMVDEPRWEGFTKCDRCGEGIPF